MARPGVPAVPARPPDPAEPERYRKWWLERYTLDELRELRRLLGLY